MPVQCQRVAPSRWGGSFDLSSGLRTVTVLATARKARYLRLSVSVLLLSALVVVAVGCRNTASTQPPHPTPTSPGATTPPSTSVPSGPASLHLQLMSQFFSKGVSGCWLLKDGTILVEGPVGHSRRYGRFYPQYDGVAQVITEDRDPTLKEITEDRLFFITVADGNGGDAFPSITDYDTKDSTLLSWKLAYLSVTQGVTVGLDLPGAARGATLEAIHLNGDSIELNWKDSSVNTRPYFEIRSDTTQKQLVIEIPDLPAGKRLALPLSTSGQGLIRSVRAEAGTSRGAGQGVTVFVSLDPGKWASLTYTQTRPTEDEAPALILTISDDKPPTDLAPKTTQ